MPRLSAYSLHHQLKDVGDAFCNNLVLLAQANEGCAGPSMGLDDFKTWLFGCAPTPIQSCGASLRRRGS
jgi:hypothetical protein